MGRIVSDRRTHADPIAVAAEQLTTTGVFLMPSFDVTRSLGVGREAWTRFARHWEHLRPDPSAASLGVARLSRHGQFLFHDGVARLMPTNEVVRPEEPLTDAFAEDPLLHRLVRLLGRVAAALDDGAEWNVKAHPFRIRSCAGNSLDTEGRPMLEGLHRDGVTLVGSLLVGRRNAIGGECSVCDESGHRLLTATLAEPGTLLLSDDRRTLHSVAPIRPVDRSGPAQRDILVITVGSRWP